jgi:hypothetical protein
MVVISHQSRGYLYFNLLVTVICLIGSYMYVFMAAHRIKSEIDTSPLVISMVMFEGIFLVDICVNFILTYEDSHHIET